MSETNINAFKAELVVAERDLDRANARVEGLKAHIDSFEPKVEVAEAVTKAPKAKKAKKAKKGKK